MSLGSPDYVPQPYLAYVDFFLAVNGGMVSLTSSNEGLPEKLLTFEHTVSTDIAGTWKLEIFDPSWDNVLTQLTSRTSLGAYGEVQGDRSGPEVQFQYYYTGGPGQTWGKISRTFTGIVEQINPTFSPQGTTIEITGHGADALLNTGLYNKAYKAPDGQGMKIHELITHILVTKHKWTPALIIPTRDIIDAEHFKGTDPVRMVFHQNSMSDLDFIRRVLIPYAVSEDGQGDYVLIPRPDETGNPTFEFRPRHYDTSPAGREFIYMWGDKNSEVISFSPSFAGAAWVNFVGGGEVDHLTFDPKTKQIRHNIKNQENTPDKKTEAPKTVQVTSTNPGTVNMKKDIAASPNAEIGDIKARAYWEHNWRTSANTAELVIQGDPAVWPGQKIFVNLILPGNRVERASSGIWSIKQAVNSIKGGEWVTSLGLIRGCNDAETSPADAIGEQISTS